MGREGGRERERESVGCGWWWWREKKEEKKKGRGGERKGNLSLTFLPLVLFVCFLHFLEECI